jgi:phosphate transport system permease protein
LLEKTNTYTKTNMSPLEIGSQLIKRKGIRGSRNTDFIFKGLMILIAVSITIPLVAIIVYITIRGVGAIDWEFLTTNSSQDPHDKGGILNALVGTIILIVIAGIISIPIGILTGTYLAESKKSKFTYYVNLAVSLLQGVPSIILGLVGYIWIVKSFGYSALAGGIMLGIMMLPMVITNTEETIKLIPESLKETSIALGVPYYKTILKVVIPASLSGIFTGILLGIARIAGETAPILFTIFGNPAFSVNIFDKIEALTLLIYDYQKTPWDAWLEAAWGASFILVVITLILNISVRIFSSKYKVKF